MADRSISSSGMATLREICNTARLSQNGKTGL
jgi:hypothetical protein